MLLGVLTAGSFRRISMAVGPNCAERSFRGSTCLGICAGYGAPWEFLPPQVANAAAAAAAAMFWNAFELNVDWGRANCLAAFAAALFGSMPLEAAAAAAVAAVIAAA